MTKAHIHWLIGILQEKLTETVRSMLTKWRNSGHIDSAIYRKLYCNDRILPKAYGAPKIHKIGYSMRIIISSIDSMLYSLTSFLHRIFKDNIPKLFSHVQNRYKLVLMEHT